MSPNVSPEEFQDWLDKCDNIRFARVDTDLATPEQVERYLPACYQILERYQGYVIVAGADVAGWTLDKYVLPRLASGLIKGQELPRVKVAIYHNTSRDAFFGLNVVFRPSCETCGANLTDGSGDGVNGHWQNCTTTDDIGKREAKTDAERHRLVKVFEYQTYYDDNLYLCERAFAAFNNGSGREDQHYFSHRLRSLSVGDVVVIGSGDNTGAYSCESAGFKPRSADELNIVTDFDPVAVYGDRIITVPWRE